MVSDDTLSHDEKLDVLSYASLAAVSVVSTIFSIAIIGPRSETSSQSTRIKAHRRSSTPLGMHGSIHQPGTVASRLLAFSTDVPLLPLPSSLRSSRLDYSYPHSLILHPSFLLSLNSRRATARIPRYVLSRQLP